MGEGTRSGLFREIIRLACELRPSFIFLENVSAITVRGGESVIGELAKAGYDARWITLSASDIGATHGRERWWCLAHAMPTRERGKQWEGKAERLTSKLAHRNGTGLQTPRTEQSTAGITGEGESMENARHIAGRNIEQLLRSEGTSKREHSAIEIAGSSKALGDSDKTRWGGVDESRRLEKEIPKPKLRGGSFERPPIPADTEGWRAYLEKYPTLEPAICGSPAWLQSRSNRIKCLGNSVDWPTAQEAFKILSGLK